jgi:hypothetical protein
LSGLICNRAIMGLAVAQQFHDRAWRGPAGNDRVTRLLNAGNVEGGHGLIGLRRTRRYSKCSPHGVCFSLHRSERGRALISSARCRRRNRRRGSRSSGFNRWPAPHVRDADEKYCTACRNKSQRRHNYSAYRRGSHDTRPLFESLARQLLGLILRRLVAIIKSTLSVSPPDQCSHPMLTWTPSLVVFAWLLREAPPDELWRNPS